MTDKELINKWTRSGLLESIPEDEKIRYASSYETAARYLTILGAYNEVQALIFPLLYRLLRINKLIDIVEIIDDVIEKYYDRKRNVRLYKDYINDYHVDVDTQSTFILDYIAEYIQEILFTEINITGSTGSVERRPRKKGAVDGDTDKLWAFDIYFYKTITHDDIIDNIMPIIAEIVPLCETYWHDSNHATIWIYKNSCDEPKSK
jgi:hypothetical protein